MAKSSKSNKPAKAESRPIDGEKLQALVMKAVSELGIAASASLVVIGDKLGLYQALAKHGPMNSEQLAKRTDTVERYIREWLINQAASGFIEYDPATQLYELSPEQRVALTDETSPAFIVGGFQSFTGMIQAQPRIMEAFRTGKGMSWGEHVPDVPIGTARFFRPGYIANLVQSWIPALAGVQAKLEKGAKVADIGCGHGYSTLLMARAFPNSKFFGFDVHAASIEQATQHAIAEGLADRVTFQVATAKDFPGKHYDLIAYFDCLHDMGEPIEAMQHAHKVLAKDGTAFIVEPMAGDTIEENFNPVGRTFSAASVLCCTPNAIASGSMALGTIATEAALREVVIAGGFTQFRRISESPVNRFFEARP